MRKNENTNVSRNKMAANRRKSVPLADRGAERGTLGSQTNSLLPNKPGVVDQTETDGQKVVYDPSNPMTNRGRPLRVRERDGLTYVDGDESSFVQTFGTSDPDLYSRLFLQVCATLPPLLRGDHNYVFSALRAIGPTDALEGQLATHMVAVSAAAMHFLALATAPGQPSEAVDANVNRVSKLFRTNTGMMEALDRRRGKIAQPVVVGNVNVAGGGQAIVGNVNHPGPGKGRKRR